MKTLHGLLLIVLLLAACQPSGRSYDTLILNGTIVDGTGNPWRTGDVAITGDRIMAIGKLSDATARRTIDATGKIVSPGFIDMLGQSGLSILVDNRAMSKISQGITTEITGEGSSVAPVNQTILEEMKGYMTRHNLTVDWKDFDGYFRRLEATGTAINLASFVGATQVREYVIGYGSRAPTKEELSEMQQLVREAMQQGALGLATSLIYAPASYAETEELIELARPASEYGGLYITHLRDEGSKIVEALLEAMDVGRNAHLPVDVWHLKVAGKKNWGRMFEIVRMIENERAQGLDITANVYPYPASSTSLSSRVPSWVHDGGSAMFLQRLMDPPTRQNIRREMLDAGPGVDNSFASTGPEGILIAGVINPTLKQYEGKRLSEIAAAWNKEPIDMMLDILVADSGRTGAVFFSMSEQDVQVALAQSWTSFCTDAGQRAVDGPLSEGKPHPRAYGSFPRILGKYVREERLLPIEEAIRKMTSLPANRVGLLDRGILRPGMFADVVVFDPNTVTDKATFENPHQYSEGIEQVFVNGVVVWEDGAHTGALPGRGLRGPGYRGQ
jgi:N-acyl-D-amino-acid deacylase